MSVMNKTSHRLGVTLTDTLITVGVIALLLMIMPMVYFQIFGNPMPPKPTGLLEAARMQMINQNHQMQPDANAIMLPPDVQINVNDRQ
jgi:hypothetical protein